MKILGPKYLLLQLFISAKNPNIANATTNHLTLIITMIQGVSPELEESGSLVTMFTLQARSHCRLPLASKGFRKFPVFKERMEFNTATNIWL